MADDESSLEESPLEDESLLLEYESSEELESGLLVSDDSSLESLDESGLSLLEEYLGRRDLLLGFRIFFSSLSRRLKASPI